MTEGNEHGPAPDAGPAKTVAGGDPGGTPRKPAAEMTPRPARLMRSFATVGGWTMASRVGGLIRDILVAAALGAGPAAEAFVAAFTLPNLFRRFFAEGAFNTAFIPMFSRRLETDGPDAARAFADQAMSLLLSVLLVLTLLAQLGMPWLVLALASGFAGDERLPLATEYARIAFPYILFISLAALLSGALNALGRFAAAAAAPVLLNVILIGAIGLAATGLFDGLAPEGAAEGYVPGLFLSWGALLAGLAQMALVWRAAAKAGVPIRPRLPRLTPEMKRLAVVFFPAALAAGVMQINLVVGRQVASFYEGAVAWLYYADRLYQLPLGVIGIAIGVVLLPELSRRLAAADEAGGREALSRSAEFALALTLPSTVALIVIPGPLIAVLFGRGAFEAGDIAATALAVAIYGAGLPAFVLQKIAQPVFFARENTTDPFRYALWGMGINVVAAVGLTPVLGFASAALATTLAAWANLFLLWRGARRYGPSARPDARMIHRAPRILAASLVMGVAAWGLEALLAPALALSGWRYAALAGLVLGSAAVYGVALVGLGGLRPADLRAAMRRGKG
ncbi:putative peptidoglycan lipid II flippase [Albimonas donghaensis]|uniref:Probable lipid II flippase MurJ n=2 Tax=Albimonas donghaensis TaxID=356660 RepID=A0A1H2YU53_9RHOB|nr:putative peptidoglycan lipid II flippase [Albimonas donghaensis]